MCQPLLSGPWPGGGSVCVEMDYKRTSQFNNEGRASQLCLPPPPPPPAPVQPPKKASPLPQLSPLVLLFASATHCCRMAGGVTSQPNRTYQRVSTRCHHTVSRTHHQTYPTSSPPPIPPPHHHHHHQYICLCPSHHKNTPHQSVGPLVCLRHPLPQSPSQNPRP